MLAVHVTVAPPVQTPFWHISPVVQLLLSSQIPLFFGIDGEQPLAESHVPAVLH
jgi:hypothetical protein